MAILAATLTAGLTACGGSSDSGDQGNINDSDQELDGSSDDTSAPGDDTVAAGSETGRFVDSAVAGIEYETSAGHISLTNNNGEFRYNEGDTVTFKLGNLNFGTVNAGQLITPVELAAYDPVKTANIARVLQTLDDDGIPDNGITITPAAREAAANQNPVDVFDADLDGSTAAVILDLASSNKVPPDTIVTAEAALEHLADTITFETRITSCGDQTSPVTEADLAGKTYGFIRQEENDKEIALFMFGSDNTLREIQNDRGEIKDRHYTWSVSNSRITQTQTDGQDTQSFDLCAANGFLIAETGSGATNFYEVKPFTKTSLPQSYVLSSFGRDEKVFNSDILRIDTNEAESLEANFLSSFSAAAANIASTGELKINFETGESALYLLAAQGKRIGIYAESFEGNLINMSIANIMAPAKPAVETTFSGNTFVDRNEADNEVIILVYNEDGTAYDYYNDSYPGGRQSAGVYISDWSVREDGSLEQIDAGVAEVFRVYDSGLVLYVESETDGTLEAISKTQAINSSAFLGTYNVNIPTENTIDNELVIASDGTCSYSGHNCTWDIDSDGKAELYFAGQSIVTQIWQLATSNDEFAFVMTEPDLVSDIQPGFMTRK